MATDASSSAAPATSPDAATRASAALAAAAVSSSSSPGAGPEAADVATPPGSANQPDAFDSDTDRTDAAFEKALHSRGLEAAVVKAAVKKAADTSDVVMKALLEGRGQNPCTKPPLRVDSSDDVVVQLADALVKLCFSRQVQLAFVLVLRGLTFCTRCASSSSAVHAMRGLACPSMGSAART